MSNRERNPMRNERLLDRLTERLTRHTARRLSRRSLLSRLGVLLVGAGAIPALPIARVAQAAETGEASDDPNDCAYWKHCAIDGFLCGCCGGSSTECPPGTEVSPITWIGTCRNPADGMDYVISYNDCCGNAGCGRCFCHRNEGDTPTYMPTRSNDLNWCLGTTTSAYHCSLSVAIGIAVEKAGAS